jgi:Amt family ammonium transporter
MQFFTRKNGPRIGLILLLWIHGVFAAHPLRAQAVTNMDTIPDPTALETPGATAHLSDTNVPSASLAAPPAPSPVATTPSPAPPLSPSGPAAGLSAPLSLNSAPPESPLPEETARPGAGETILAALLSAGALGGFILYYCGLTRAKNCGHTSTLLLLGAAFALAGYWAGGFAVQAGGIGDAHAALPGPLVLDERGALDHELGFMAGGHHWGFMGSAGFFLSADESSREAMAALFLVQAAGLVVAVGAMLGAALERGRILAMSVMAFLAGAVIYPLIANWIWGGGWLAALGRGFGLGNGVIDLAGSGVVHETAGALALAVALVLGSRHGRYNGKAFFIPGHNVPFTIVGALLLLLAWISANAFAPAGPSETGTTFATAAVNVVLGGVGGILTTMFLNSWRRQRATPARLSRGLLGGAVALSSGSALFDPWAALVIGLLAGLVVDGTMSWLDRKRIDDPAGATAVHGAAGAWGLLATGLFANGTAGRGMNAVDAPVRGLFFGGAWHQLAAQAAGAAVIFATAFALGGTVLLLLNKILGNRVRLADEIQGLDWPQVGALGYQPDVEPDEPGAS